MNSCHTDRLLVALACILLLVPLTEASVHIFQREQADLLFKQHKQTLMLLLGDQDESSTTFEAVSSVSKQHPGVLFTYSKVGEEPYSKLI